jgi:hypothetical protein
MKSKYLKGILATLATTVVCAAIAAESAEDAKQLGPTLTSFGAVTVGN